MKADSAGTELAILYGLLFGEYQNIADEGQLRYPSVTAVSEEPHWLLRGGREEIEDDEGSKMTGGKTAGVDGPRRRGG